MSDDSQKEPEVRPWEQVAEEPDEQYKWFSQYYLPLGFQRTIRGAYSTYVINENPPGKARLGKGGEGHTWYKAAEDWEWGRRARAYDEAMGREAEAVVKQAVLKLKTSTVQAVDTLIKNLESPRNAVAAANSILDRGGVPAKSTSEVLQTVHVTADEMAQAVKEVTEWENQIADSSGSNADSQ
jgi:hypothetical protein